MVKGFNSGNILKIEDANKENKSGLFIDEMPELKF